MSFARDERVIAAMIGAGWISPAAGEIAAGDFMYPAIAGGLAYFAGSRYGMLAGYASGALVYAVVTYNDLSDLVNKIKSKIPA